MHAHNSKQPSCTTSLRSAPRPPLGCGTTRRVGHRAGDAVAGSLGGQGRRGLGGKMPLEEETASVGDKISFSKLTCQISLGRPVSGSLAAEMIFLPKVHISA